MSLLQRLFWLNFHLNKTFSVSVSDSAHTHKFEAITCVFISSYRKRNALYTPNALSFVLVLFSFHCVTHSFHLMCHPCDTEHGSVSNVLHIQLLLSSITNAYIHIYAVSRCLCVYVCACVCDSHVILLVEIYADFCGLFGSFVNHTLRLCNTPTFSFRDPPFSNSLRSESN